MSFFDERACVRVDGYEMSARVSSTDEWNITEPLDYLMELAAAWKPNSLFRVNPLLLEDCTAVVKLDASTLSVAGSLAGTELLLTCKTPQATGCLRACEPFRVPRAIGEMTAFVIRVSVPEREPEPETLKPAYAHCVIGLMSWLNSETADVLEEVRLASLLRNVDFVDSSTEHAIRPLLRPVPLLDLASESFACTCTLSAKAVLSFALMWHMARTHATRLSDDTDLTAVLEKRSLRYFFTEAPRKALLGSKAGFIALRNTASLLHGAATSSFFAAQIADAVRFALSRSRGLILPRMQMLRDCVAAFCEFVDAVPNPRTEWLYDGVQSLCLVEPVSQLDLPADVVDWLGVDSLCLSFDVCGLLANFLGFYKEMYVHAGRVYVVDEAAQEKVAGELMRFYLRQVSGSAPTAVGTVDWDDQFCRAMPVEGAVYADHRVTQFDDCSLQSHLFRSVSATLDQKQFKAFAKCTGAAVDLPEDYNGAALYALTQSDVALRQGGSTIEPVARRIALLAVSRTPLSRARRHVVVEYDAGKRSEVEKALVQQCEADKTMRDETNLYQALMQNSGGQRTADLDAIEDIVLQIMGNRALPLCAVQFATRIRDGGTHLNNEERKAYYRLLDSLGVPELDHDAILRHMLSVVRSKNKLAEQFKDVNRFQTMMTKMHERAAEGHQRALLEHSSSEVSREDALARTTSAPSCRTMIDDKRQLRLCPFKSRTPAALAALLEAAGIDATRAAMIADGAGQRDPQAMCRLHIMAASTRSIAEHMDGELQRLADRTRHPRDFTQIVALASLFKAEANVQR
jgi:hypothetical protein